MNHACSLAKNQLQRVFYSDSGENLSDGGSHLSEEFCSKVLGKPCLSYSKTVKKSSFHLNEKKYYLGVSKAAVYTLTEESSNPFVTEKDSTKAEMATKSTGMSNQSFKKDNAPKSKSEGSVKVENPKQPTASQSKSINRSVGLETENQNSQSAQEISKKPINYSNKNEQTSGESKIEWGKKIFQGDQKSESLQVELGKEIRNLPHGNKDKKDDIKNIYPRYFSLDETAQRKINNRDYQFRPCYCDEKSQTSHPSIVRNYPEIPVKDTSPFPPKENPNYVDKSFQTANKFTNNQNNKDNANKAVNTKNMESINVQATEIMSSKAQTTKSFSDQIFPPKIDKCICHQPSQRSKCCETVVCTNHIDDYLETETLCPTHNTDFGQNAPEHPCLCCNCLFQSKPTYAAHCICSNYHGEPQCQCCRHKIVPCSAQCRRKPHPSPRKVYKPKAPQVPKFDYSSSECDDDDDVQLIIDHGDDSDSLYSEENQDQFEDLPYQNSEDYDELVQELEENIQKRNKSRVRRALLEFEQKSKNNCPLEKPIIDYEESSETEEALLKKIAQLAEKRKNQHKLFPCQGRACCTFKMSNKQEISNQTPPPKKREPPFKPSLRRPTSRRPRWIQDKKTGEWYRVSPADPHTCIPSLQYDENFCSCSYN